MLKIPIKINYKYSKNRSCDLLPVLRLRDREWSPCVLFPPPLQWKKENYLNPKTFQDNPDRYTMMRSCYLMIYTYVTENEEPSLSLAKKKNYPHSKTFQVNPAHHKIMAFHPSLSRCVSELGETKKTREQPTSKNSKKSKPLNTYKHFLQSFHFCWVLSIVVVEENHRLPHYQSLVTKYHLEGDFLQKLPKQANHCLILNSKPRSSLCFKK